MSKKIAVLLVAFMPFAGSLQAGFWDYFFPKEEVVVPKTIKVLIVHDKPGVVLEVKGKYSLYDPNIQKRSGYKHISSRFLGKRKFIQSVADGIRWGEEFPGVFQLLIVPEEETTKTVVDGISYKGSLYVYNIAETGTISIVNEVLLDDYLDSVLSNQFNKERLSEEAAAAVAIVARTNALYFALNPKSAFWSVDGTEVGYLGNSNIKFASPVVQAIEATRKMVMSQASNEGTKPFPAEWAQLLDQTKKDAKLAAITLQDAERLAQKGDHAAEILKKAFPGTSIQLTD